MAIITPCIMLLNPRERYSIFKENIDNTIQNKKINSKEDEYDFVCKELIRNSFILDILADN